jgi:hypothetical protein
VAAGWEVERERTYVVDPADAPAVHRLLTPPDGALPVSGGALRVQPRPANVVLHVYTRVGWTNRRRVLIELTGRRRIRLSEKRWSLRRGGPVKLDRRRWISEAEAWDELAGGWKVAFVKARFPLELTGPGDGAVLRARIDVMCPVAAGGELRPDGTFAHVEIEARSDGADPSIIERTPSLWHGLGPLLAPLTRPKADIAADAGATALRARSATEVAALVRDIDRALADLMGATPYAGLAARHAELAGRAG